MLNTPFSPWPCFTAEEIEAVANVLRSNRVNYWTGGEGAAFESEFAEWAGCRHAVALANGTVALELALRALSIGPGDEVVVTPRTFIASVSAVANVGARPVFADVDPEWGNLSAVTIAAALTPATRAVICVHLAGVPCDMDPIMKLAREHRLKVIEDCAQAHGARYRGRSVGTIGDIGAWSFCQDKIMTTGGEGGMVTTNDRDLWSFIWSQKDHGKSWDVVQETKNSEGYRWLHTSFGSNGRMTEMQAALGRVQLKRMAEWTARRTENATRIMNACRRHEVVRVPAIPDDVRSGWYKLYVFVRPDKLADGWSRDRIMAEIISCGVPCYWGTCSEVYLEEAFTATGLRPSQPLPVARELGETGLMFLVHPTLTPEEIEKTCQAVSEVLPRATR